MPLNPTNQHFESSKLIGIMQNHKMIDNKHDLSQTEKNSIIIQLGKLSTIFEIAKMLCRDH